MIRRIKYKNDIIAFDIEKAKEMSKDVFKEICAQVINDTSTLETIILEVYGEGKDNT
jgi:hypothetical protein